MSKFGISQPVRRVEDVRFLTGKGQYIDDLNWDGQARAYFLRSQVASGRFTIDVGPARAAPGVLQILTGADLQAAGANDVSCGTLSNRDGTDSKRPVRPVIAVDRIRYVGEALAMIVAETLAEARDAAERIELDIDEGPAVADMRTALAPDAPQVHDDAPGNLVFDWATGDEATVDAELASAAHVVEIEIVNNRVISNPMETRGVLAAWDAAAERLHVETNAQGVWDIKGEVAKQLSLSADQVKVTTQDVGGGFGTKSYAYPEQVAVAFGARALGRPIKWIADRSEGFLTDSMGRDHVTVARAAFDEGYSLRAVKIETLAGMGAYLSPFAPYIPTMAGSRVAPGVYDLQKLFLGVKGVFTHTTPVDAYRGAGRPEAIYLIERLMDKAARLFGMDPMALRFFNFIPTDKMPYRSAVGELYDVGDFDRVAKAALERADIAGFPTRAAATEAIGKRRGVGYCYYIESILGDQNETATIDIGADGAIELYVGTQSNGQGHETAFAQILSHRCGVPFERIRLVQGDSDRIATGGGTGGSRSVTMQGCAINAAADALVAQLKPMAEEALEVGAADIEFSDGAYRVAGTDQAITVTEVALKARSAGRADLATITQEFEVPGRSFPNGCHIAEVEVDPETGVVTVDKYTMVDDFGVLINPMLAEGQAHGGVVQGIGQALTEIVAYDENAQLLTGSFMDYGMPRADNAPMIAFHSEPVPSTANPIGMKGCGEAGTVGALAAVTNAVLDALWPLGVRDVDMPLTPLKVWETVEAAKTTNTTPIAAE